MLAVRPPGMQTDVAPTWMVDTATAHSKAEYQRGERVTKSQHDVRQRGKGRGKGKKGADGATNPP